MPQRKFNFEKVYFGIFFGIFIFKILREVFSSWNLFVNNYDFEIYSIVFSSAVSSFVFSSAVWSFFITIIAKFIIKNYKGKAELPKITYNKLAIIGYIVSLPLQFLAFFIVFGSYLGPWIYSFLLLAILIIPFTALWQIKKSGTGGKLFAIVSIVIILLAGYSISFPLLKENLGEPTIVERETVMTEGMKIVAHTSFGTLAISAGKGFERIYTWDNCTRNLTMWPRGERWYGSYGIYYPGPGNHWQNCNGITRAVVEEGQQKFNSIDEAMNFLNAREKGSVYTHDGLVVQWGLVPERNQLNAEVWQIFINGNKPTQLLGAQDNAIVITSY